MDPMSSFTKCQLLPPVIEILDGQSYENYLDKLYLLFTIDFKNSQPLFKGKRVGCRRLPEVNGREEGFYHLTHKESRKDNRIIDFERAKRFPWNRKIIENYGCARDCCTAIKYWEESNGKTYILFEEERYVIILQKRKDYYVIITAFYLEYKNAIDKLLKKYNSKK